MNLSHTVCPSCGSVDLLFSAKRQEHLCEDCGHRWALLAATAGFQWPTGLEPESLPTYLAAPLASLLVLRNNLAHGGGVRPVTARVLLPTHEPGVFDLLRAVVQAIVGTEVITMVYLLAGELAHLSTPPFKLPACPIPHLQPMVSNSLPTPNVAERKEMS